MDETIYDANVYSSFLEGTATKEETWAILDRMMQDPLLVMELNLAASGNMINSKNII